MRAQIEVRVTIRPLIGPGYTLDEEHVDVAAGYRMIEDNAPSVIRELVDELIGRLRARSIEHFENALASKGLLE